MGAAGVAGSTLSVLSACTVSTTPQSSDGGWLGGRERAQPLQLVGVHSGLEHKGLREGDRGEGYPGLLRFQRGASGQAPGRRHGLRRHRPLRLHGRRHDQERDPRGARLLQDPQLRQHRRELQGAVVRSGEQVQRALPVGDHGHPLQREGDGQGRQLGRHVGPAIRGQDRHDGRRQGDHGGGAGTAWLPHKRDRRGAVGGGQATATRAEAAAQGLLRRHRERAACG